MARTALMIGGPYHLRKLKVQTDHLRIIKAPVMSWEKPPDEGNPLGVIAHHEPLIYQPRNWFGSEVWVLDSMSNGDAMDQLLTSVFQSHKGH